MVLCVLVFVSMLRTVTSCWEETNGISPATATVKYATVTITRKSEIVRMFNIPSKFTRSDRGINIAIRSCEDAVNCLHADTIPYVLSWNDSDMNGTNVPQSKEQQSRCFRTADSASRPIPVHFTEDGTFSDGKYYYSPDGDYCLEEHDEKSMTLRLCSVHTQPSIFLPKCCPLNEVIYLRSTCRKLSENQPKWKPELYLANADGSHTVLNYDTSNLKMYNEVLPSQCKQIEPVPHPYFFYLSPTGMGTGVKHNVKLVVRKNKPQKVVPMIFHADIREWVIKEHFHYCLDATYLATSPPQKNRSLYYAGGRNDFVIYVCSSDDPYDDNYEYQNFKAWAYSITTAISSAFLLVIVLIYLVTLKQHNLHGLTVLMYSIAMLGRYLFACIAYFISIYPNDHITGVTNRGWPCVTISIVGHYFYLSSYLWLTVMNVNFYLTFRKPLVVTRNARRLKSLLTFSLFGWGLPVVLVGMCVLIDITYRDPLTMVPVPGYGELVCFVARPFRGYYVYAPMGVMLGVNIPLILMTLAIFWNARMVRKNELGECIYQITPASDYSAGFFLKKVIIMGGADLVSFLTWCYHKPIQEDAVKPMWVIVLEAANFLAPVPLFILFCLNRRIRKQLMVACS